MSIDDKLLNNNSSAEKAGNLREEQRGNSGNGSDGDDQESSEEQNFSEVIQAERAKKDNKEGAASKALSKATAPIRRSTSKLLQQSWLNLIDSWGLTLIWINIHVFLKTVLGEKLFCKLGHEWLPDEPAKITGAADLAEGLGGELKKAEGMAGIVEVMGLGCLDSIALLILLFIAAIIYLIVSTNPLLLVLKVVLGALWGALTNGSK